jgi:hypothetical protein
MSPDYAWWYGYAEVLGHSSRIRYEADRLRTEVKTTARTNFMLYTGPIMVLAVVGVVWAGRAVYRKRKRA